MKRSSAFLALAAVLAIVMFAAPVFAEVQNVRVGGDITLRSFWRHALRFSEDRDNGVGGATGNTAPPAGPGGAGVGGGQSSTDNFLQSALGLNVSADLTDNVSVDTRLLNQRVWGSHAQDASNTAAAATSASNSVGVALAYVTLKELFYSPLTVRVGRQNLWYGRGMIVGSRLLAGDSDPNQNIAADEFTEDKGFDAIRGTLDFDPATLDILYAKVDENAVNAGDDVNLLGLNLGYKFPDLNGEAEIYWFNKRDKNQAGIADTNANQGRGIDGGNDANVNTIGLRGSIEPVAHLTTFAEVAYQTGDRGVSTSALGTDSEGKAGDALSAWMLNWGADYVWADAQWTPRAGLEWTLYSGDNKTQTAIAGWDPMFRGSFSTLIREFQNVGLYMPSQSGATQGGTFNALTGSSTNQHALQLRGGLKPLQDLDVGTSWTVFWTDKGIHPVEGSKRQSFLGHEWDTKVVYDYTEDVQFGLIYGVLWPGTVFRNPYRNTAQELVTSVKVSF